MIVSAEPETLPSTEMPRILYSCSGAWANTVPEALSEKTRRRKKIMRARHPVRSDRENERIRSRETRSFLQNSCNDIRKFLLLYRPFGQHFHDIFHIR